MMTRRYLGITAACLSLLMSGCVQSSSVDNYTSTTTLRYGDGQSITRTQTQHWQRQGQQSATWQAVATPHGNHLEIRALPPAPSTNIIVVPTQAPCHHAPYIERDIIYPDQAPCREQE